MRAQHAIQQNRRKHGGEFICRSCAQTGKPKSEAQRQKASETMKGKKWGRNLK